MKRLAIVPAVVVSTVLASASSHPTDSGRSYDLARDVLRTSNQISFRQGAAGVWYFLESSSLTHNPGLYRFLPDYSAPCVSNERWASIGMPCWLDEAAVYAGIDRLPLVGMNFSDATVVPDVDIFIPPRSVFVHPAEEKLVIVAWKSPIDGLVRVTGLVSDLDPKCDNGIVWSVDHGAHTLRSGTLPNAGAPQPIQLRRVQVETGDVLYFVVDAGAGDWACDSTGLSVRISEVENR